MNESMLTIKNIHQEVRKAVIGKDEIILNILMAILAKGHILIEDIPGVGKTTMAIAFSKAMELKQNRIQFTPDVLPTDVVGFNIMNKISNEFEYKPGAVMCNLFLADEINRTSSKTQSALLEVMEEGKVTVDGVTRELEKPFIVIATQNPIGSVGTQLLPESQMDRFMVRLTMGYPDINSEIDMLKGKHNNNPLDDVKRVISQKELLEMQSIVEKVYIHNDIYAYIASLVLATRQNPMIELGVSPRGTIAIAKMSKAAAFVNGRNYVIPQDVRKIFESVTEHRILLNSRARMGNIDVYMVIKEILNRTYTPKVG